ncbi:MAG TPA: hypothetical protein VJB02_02115, partial [Coxiellaceae bacterium]|nr:hypothetical protein [Coxiellaceae bacterium]
MTEEADIQLQQAYNQLVRYGNRRYRRKDGLTHAGILHQWEEEGQLDDIKEAVARYYRRNAFARFWERMCTDIRKKQALILYYETKQFLDSLLPPGAVQKSQERIVKRSQTPRSPSASKTTSAAAAMAEPLLSSDHIVIISAVFPLRTLTPTDITAVKRFLHNELLYAPRWHQAERSAVSYWSDLYRPLLTVKAALRKVLAEYTSTCLSSPSAASGRAMDARASFGAETAKPEGALIPVLNPRDQDLLLRFSEKLRRLVEERRVEEVTEEEWEATKVGMRGFLEPGFQGWVRSLNAEDRSRIELLQVAVVRLNLQGFVQGVGLLRELNDRNSEVLGRLKVWNRGFIAGVARVQEGDRAMAAEMAADVAERGTALRANAATLERIEADTERLEQRLE